MRIGYEEEVALETANTALTDTRESKKTADDAAARPEARAKAAEVVAAKTAEVQSLADRFPTSPGVQETATRHAILLRDDKTAAERSERAVAAAEARQDPAALSKALSTRALVSHLQGDPAAANADAERALELDPTNARASEIAKYTAGAARGGRTMTVTVPFTLDRQRVEELVGDAAWTAAKSPSVAEAEKRALAERQAVRLMKEGLDKLGLNDPRAMLRILDRAQALGPLVPHVYMQRGLAWQALGNPVAAWAEASKAIDLWSRQEGGNPSLPSAHTLRSQAQVELKDYPAALRDAEEAVRLAPKSAPALFARGSAREAMGQPAERFLPDYETAGRIDPSNFAERYQSALGRAKKGGAAGSPRAFFESAPFWAVLGVTVLAAALVGVGLVWAFGFKAGRLTAALNGSAPVAAAAKRKGERYEVEDAPFARGGMGSVHEGYDRHLGRKVAAKRLHPAFLADPRERSRFRHEARALAKLNHPNIVALYDFVDYEERLEIIFEYVEGKTVSQLMDERAGRRLEPGLAASVVEAACKALAYAHAEGIIHRDIKPSNLMVTGSNVVKVMDFGISRSVKDTLGTMTNTPCGTPFYMAPEQEQGVVRRESDLYSVGVTAYEMLTGRLPFEGPAALQLKLSGKFSEAWVPPPLLPFFGRILDPEPTKRWNSAKEMHEAFASTFSITPRGA